MLKLVISKTKNADTRTAENKVTKEELLRNSELHIRDVSNVANMLANKLMAQCENHDYTKIKYINAFHKDFTSGLQSTEFKSMPWFQKHLTERHHLNDRCPEDVNLIDVLEMVIDCTVAGLARSGKVYPINISKEVIEKAIENTKQFIIENTKVL